MAQTILDEVLVEILDDLVKNSFNRDNLIGRLDYNEYPIISDDIFKKYPSFIINTSNKYNDYRFYLEILEEYNIVKVEKWLGSFDIISIPGVTEVFIKQGGFKTIFNKQQTIINRDKELDEKNYQKLQWETKLAKWKYRTFWPVLISGLIGGVFAMYSIISPIFSETVEQKIQRILENKLKSIKPQDNTLPNQLHIDTLTNNKTLEKN
jgi:hypothetical protein